MSMKAIQVTKHGGPDVLLHQALPDPIPGRNEVLVRVRAAGVNPVDTYLRSGQNGYGAELPWTPGLCGAGEVVAVGEGSMGRLPPEGARVWFSSTTTGASAELAACPLASVHKLPDGISFEQGALLGVPAMTAWRAVADKLQPRAGQWVLVHGASGAVGQLCVQMLKAAGCKVIGTAGSNPGREAVRACGADVALNHKDDRRSEMIQLHTGNAGVDGIIEMLAEKNLKRDLDLLATGGKLVVVGCRGVVQHFAPRDLMKRDLQVLGLSLFNASTDDLSRAASGIGMMLLNGELKPQVARTYALEDIRQAHQDIMNPPDGGTTGGLVLTC